MRCLGALNSFNVATESSQQMSLWDFLAMQENGCQLVHFDDKVLVIVVLLFEELNEYFIFQGLGTILDFVDNYFDVLAYFVEFRLLSNTQ